MRAASFTGSTCGGGGGKMERHFGTARQVFTHLSQQRGPYPYLPYDAHAYKFWSFCLLSKKHRGGWNQSVDDKCG